jgi:poly(beta-D-mannuronate) lyase
MEAISSVDIEETTTGTTSSSNLPVDDDPSEGFSTDADIDGGATAESTPSIDTSWTDIQLLALTELSSEIAQVNTSDLDSGLANSVGEVLEETSQTVGAVDPEKEEDLETAKEMSDDLQAAGEELISDGGGGDLSPETQETLTGAGEVLTEVSEVIDIALEIADADPIAGAVELGEIEITLNDMAELAKAAAKDGDLSAALTEIFGLISGRKEDILASYELIFGITANNIQDDADQDDVLTEQIQRQKQAENIQAAQSNEGNRKIDGKADVSLNGAGAPASTGVDLSGWKLTLPADTDGDGEADEIDDIELLDYAGSDNMRTNADGSVTFSSYTTDPATTANSNYPRSELREMMRAGNDAIDTHDPQNNWVTSAASKEEQDAAGGVDGTMAATLSVDRVTEGGDAEQAGRVIIGQVHAMEDEPVRLYYHKAPDSETGAIYFAHEPQNGGEETFHVLFGDDTGHSTDGIALGEAFSYNIDITGTNLTVSVTKQDGTTAEETVDMAASGYDAAGTQMYFKAGVYSQNNTTPDSSTDFAEATFYGLETGHNGEALDGPANPIDVAPPPHEPGVGEPRVDEPSVDESGTSDPLDPTIPSDPVDPDGLSGESSTGGDPSAANQEKLEQRFIALYELLMEKQIAFKEKIEPYKTDNQNAGKG